MVLSETRGLWLSSIVRGGIGLRRRLSARRHEKPDNVTGYFTLETERLKNPTATARNGSPGMERTLSQRRSSCLLFQMFSKRTSFFQTINVIAAIFLAKVRRAIVGFLPLASKFS